MRIDAMIIGAQKAGTTSLLRYLAEHPALGSHETVECGYFASDTEYEAGWPPACDRYFRGVDADMLVGKSAGVYVDERYIARLAKHNPDCVVVLVLRDPTQRAYSAYQMERGNGWIDREFEHLTTVLNDEKHVWNRLFIQMGDYPAALKRTWKYFDRSQVLVFIFEEFVRDPLEPCRQVFKRLGVDDSFIPEIGVAHNETVVPRSMRYAAAVRRLRSNPVAAKVGHRLLSPSQRDRLRMQLIRMNATKPVTDGMSAYMRKVLSEHYRSRNQEVEELLGRRLTQWSGME